MAALRRSPALHSEPAALRPAPAVQKADSNARARGGGQLQHAPFLTPSDATLADKRAYHRRLLGHAPAAEHAKAA